MTRIDFAFGAKNRLRTACETVLKQYAGGRRMLVYCQDQTLLQRFNQFLWGFQDSAFIPHVYADDPLADKTAIVFTNSLPARSEHDAGLGIKWLLNLDQHCPPDTEQFDRILEIVSLNENDITQARKRWKNYQQLGHELHAHDLRKRQGR